MSRASCEDLWLLLASKWPPKFQAVSPGPTLLDPPKHAPTKHAPPYSLPVKQTPSSLLDPPKHRRRRLLPLSFKSSYWKQPAWLENHAIYPTI